jgi:hypothetical protein
MEKESEPLVSMICPTYARPPAYQHLLEERVESFLRQEDYPNRELVILSDCFEQELRLEEEGKQRIIPVPLGTVRERYYDNGVRIVNWPNGRFPSLGEKYNALVNLAKGVLLMPAEDDDLHLPHAIRQAVTMLGDFEMWKGPQVIYWPSDSPPIFKHSVGVRHHASIFRRSAWEKVGGYPPVSGAQDAAFDSLLRANCRVAPEGDLGPADFQYCYRWGCQPYHLSGKAPHDAWYAEIGRMPVKAGTFHLRPHWRQDYVRIVQEALKNEQA